MCRWLLILLTFGLAACSVSPRPEPPSSDPPRLATDLVLIETCPLQCDGPFFTVVGDQGAVSDPDAVVWAVNLDSIFPPQEFPVADDGSFHFNLEGLEGDELRIQVRLDNLRSDPVDLIGTSGSFQPSVRPLQDCFAVAPPLELDLLGDGPTASSVAVSNLCADTLRIERIALRTDVSELDLGSPSVPMDLALGESATVSVQFTPAARRGVEEILFIEASAPTRDRRPISLLAGASE